MTSGWSFLPPEAKGQHWTLRGEELKVLAKTIFKVLERDYAISVTVAHVQEVSSPATLRVVRNHIARLHDLLN